jgi:hypothetical protein
MAMRVAVPVQVIVGGVMGSRGLTKRLLSSRLR